MQPFHTFNNLTDFFTEPPNFLEFTSVRKPSQIGELECFEENQISLSLDFLDSMPRTPIHTSNPENQLMLSDFEIPVLIHDPREKTIVDTPIVVQKSTRKVTATTEIKKKFYNKNSARNIVRKTIRCIEAETYKVEVRNICIRNNQDYDDFCDAMSNVFEEMTGPTALRKFLQTGSSVAKVFREFMIWFLKERYAREALTEGHMEDLKQYINYKNRELLPMLMEF